MKVIKRLIFCIMFLIYFIMVLLIPLWWFIPQLLVGKSHETILQMYFDFMHNYSENLFEK